MGLFSAVGWLLRFYVNVFGPYGVVALVVVLTVLAAVVLWSFRQVTGFLGRIVGVRDFKWSEWKVTHPTSWRWMRAGSAVATFATSGRMLLAHPSVGLPLVAFTISGAWVVVKVATFWSGYPLSWDGLVAAAQTAVTKQALDLVWQAIGVVSVQRGKLRLPRYESWSEARTLDGWLYGLHCNGFVPPQGTGGLAQIMEMCASPGSEYDTITSNLNNILLDPGELRGPLVTLLRYTNRLPLYAGTAVDRPDGYPQGVGRLTMLQRLPLERTRKYPWRPGWWADQVADRARVLAESGTDEQRANPLGHAVAELVAGGAPVAFDQDGRVIRADTDDEHTCLMGSTRTGKSTLLECLLHFIVEMPTSLVRLAILDMKGGAHLHGYRERASVFSTTPEEAEFALRFIYEQIVKPRYDALRNSDQQKITVPTEAMPFWYLIVDEGWKLSPEGMELLASIAREGAAGHVIVVFSTQYMRTEDGFIRSLDVNLTNRMATRLPDATAGAKAMTRAGMNASCAPNLIRRSKRTRGIFCHSAGGVDPAYAKSALTGGIRDQRRRARAAVRRWGAPVIDAPEPVPCVPAVVEPERELPPEPAEWDTDRAAAADARLAELAGFCAPGARVPPVETATRKQLATLVNLARRTHNPTRMPAGPDRDGVQQARTAIERLAAALADDLQARDTASAELVDPALVS